MSLCTALGRFRHWMLTSTLSKPLCWILNFILKRSVRVRGGERVLCKCTPCLESSGGAGVKQCVRTERYHRQKEQDRQAKAAAARELRQQQRDMRRQEVLAAEAEEEAEIARAEAEVNLFPDDDFASAFGYSAFDETLNDSRSSDSGQSESKSEAASLAPPASPRKCKLFLLCETMGRSATQWIECLAHKPFSLPCLACLSLGVCSCAGSAVSRVGQRFSRLRRLSDRGLCVRQRARECRPGAADSVGILSQDSARRRTGRVVVPSKAPAI